MKPTQRIEIIIDALHTPKVLDILDEHGVKGWSVLDVARGHGERGMRRDDGLSVRSGNQLVLTTYDDDITALMEVLRPLLKRYGGVCLVSDARWLLHRDAPETEADDED